MPEQKWTQTNWTEAMRDACKKALSAIGLHLQGQASLLAPVLTGRLAGSITYAVQNFQSPVHDPPRPPKRIGPKATQRDAVDKPKDEWTLHVGTNVEYAAHVEYGTVRMPDQTFLRYALDMEKGRCVKMFAEQMQKAIRVHGK